MKSIPGEKWAPAAIDLTAASRGAARTVGYAVMAGAVVAAEILLGAEAVLHRVLGGRLS